MSLESIQNGGIPVIKVGIGQSRNTTASDDWYIVVQVKRYKNQNAGNIVQKMRPATEDRYPGLQRNGTFIQVAYSPVVPHIVHHW